MIDRDDDDDGDDGDDGDDDDGSWIFVYRQWPSGRGAIVGTSWDQYICSE